MRCKWLSYFLLFYSLIFLIISCKPKKKENIQNNKARLSQERAANNPKAFSLVGIKNAINIGPLSSNPGARYSQLLTKTTLFAIIDCPDLPQLPSRVNLGDIETSSALGIIYAKSNRKLIRRTNADGKDEDLMCFVKGERLISAPVLDRVMSLPYVKKEQTTEDEYFAAQTAYLAIRGLFVNNAKPYPTPALINYQKMIQEHWDHGPANISELQNAMGEMDKDLNPCLDKKEGARLTSSLLALRAKFYACVKAGKGFSYELTNEKPYQAALEAVSKVFSTVHSELYGPVNTGDKIDTLWDALTSTKPLSKQINLTNNSGLNLTSESKHISFTEYYSSPVFGSSNKASFSLQSSTSVGRTPKPALHSAIIAPLLNAELIEKGN